MDLRDYAFVIENLETSELMGSDSAIANIFLLQKKYNTKIHLYNNFLFREYFGEKNRSGFAFPLRLKEGSGSSHPYPSASASDLKAALKTAIEHIFLLNSTAANHNSTAKTKTFKTDVRFCLCTQTQKNLLDECFRNYFPSYKIDWKTTRDDSDYIYLREKLEKLSGSALQKKKNHISQFMRAYENRWCFKLFPQNAIAEDMLTVEENWFFERSNDVEKAFDDKALQLERESIKLALEHASLFKMTGGVLYVDEKPVAMCLASPVNELTLDIHFEKVMAQTARNGGYAVINNLFASQCKSYKFINREEDVGVEGLRKAKLSYKPEMLLEKFSGQVLKC